MDLPIDASESLISTMISEKKVKAHLNQFEQYVYFSSGKEMILKFNELIANLCEEINQVIESLNEKYPSLKKLKIQFCLLYTSDAADDTPCVDLGGRRIIKKKKMHRTHHNYTSDKPLKKQNIHKQ
eukprot:TRINITY_DN3150_c0_g1_i2.p2 TRINITY_DN3150_c0_g1~~TRINITY_DN3150_c0_g1_i2.p2  ORF type:complete len:126 (-),score=30.18 TRINITY_DN3150_c0_g1_i2:18-395(-)